MTRLLIAAALAGLCLAAPAFAQDTVATKALDNVKIAKPVILVDPSTGNQLGSSTNPFAVSRQYGPSGVTPVTAALTATGSTSAFTPIAGRDFNVSVWGTFVGSIQLERSFDSGTTWLPITAAGTQLYVWTAPASEQASEPEYAVQYRARVTSYTSGTLNVRLSQ